MKMKMTDNTKMLLGAGALALAGYFIWKQNQEKKNFVRRRRSARIAPRVSARTAFAPAARFGQGQPDIDLSKERLEQAKMQAMEIEKYRQGLENDLKLQAIEARIVTASVDTYLNYACAVEWDNMIFKPVATKEQYIAECRARKQEPTVQGRFLKGGCRAADCRSGDYIYCKGKDTSGHQNFALKMEDGTPISDIKECGSGSQKAREACTPGRLVGNANGFEVFEDRGGNSIYWACKGGLKYSLAEANI